MKMKRKLFFLFCSLLGMLTSTRAASTDYLTGWTKVTTEEKLQTAISNDSYFALISGRGSDWMIKGMSYGSENRLTYQSPADPVMDNGFVWILEYSDADSKYYLKNANSSNVYYGYTGDASYDYVAVPAYTTKTSANTALTASCDNEKFAFITSNHATDKYLGPWDGKDYFSRKGERFAGNKVEDEAEKFIIYAISRTDYETKRTAIINAATSASGQNVTFLLPDASFDVTQPLSPWTGDITICGGAQYGSYVSETYHKVTDIYQTITVPNGKYTVSAQGTYRQDDSSTDKAMFYAGSETSDLTNHSSLDLSDYSGNDAEKVQQYLIAHPEDKAMITDILVTEGSLTVGIKTDQASTTNLWTVYDNFQLTYYGNAVEVYAPEATDFSTAKSATDDTWYKVTTVNKGYYEITSNGAVTLRYTQDATKDADANDFLEMEFAAAGSQRVLLNSGSFYFKSNATVNIKVEYLGNDVQYYAPEATDFSIAKSATDNTWYKVTTANKGYYEITSDGAATLSYTQDATKDADANDFSGIEFKEAGSQRVLLNSGSFYFKSNATVNIKVEYLGNDVQYYAPNATDFSSETAVTASTWYAFTVSSAGGYKISSTAAVVLSYSQSGTKNADDNDFSTLSITEGSNGRLNMSAGTFYFKSGADSEIKIEQVWADGDDITTEFMTNPSFETGSGSEHIGWNIGYGNSTSINSDNMQSGSLGEGGGSQYMKLWTNSTIGSSVYQTVSSLPAGNYKLSAYMSTGEGTTLTLKAGSVTNAAVAADGSTITMEVYFTLNSAQNVEFAAGSLSAGAWYNMDNFKLTYNPSLPGSVTAVSGKMSSSVSETQTAAIAAYNEEQTMANMLAAQEAKLSAVQSILVYREIAGIQSRYASKAENLDAAGQSAYSTAINTSSTGAAWKYDNDKYETAAEAEAAFHNDYVTAVKAQTTANTDMTEVITNPSFEKGNLDGWTSSNGGWIAGNDNWPAGKVGAYFVERWEANSGSQTKLSDGTLTQTITSMPAGKYMLTANAQNIEQYNSGANGTGYFITLGTAKTEVNSDVFTAVCYDLTSAGSLLIGAELKDCTGNWISCDNFQLTYIGTDLPASLPLYGETDYMNADIKSAANSAISAYNSSNTLENYSAAQTAIHAAEASLAVYVTISDIMSAYATKAATLDAAGQSAYSTAINTSSTGAAWKYYNGMYATSAEAETVFHSNYVAAVRSQNTAGADMTGLITNPSFETGDLTGWTVVSSSDDTGVRSTAGYTMSGSDGDYLFNTWWQGIPMTQNIGTLPAGYYKLSAVTTTAKDAKTYLKVNSGHNDGAVSTGGSDIGVHNEYIFTLNEATETTIGVVGCADDGYSYSGTGHYWYKVDDFRLTYLGNTSAMMAVNSTAQWGTFCAPFDVTIPSGVKAYTCSGESDGVLTLVEVTGGTIYANTPVILNAESGLASTTFYGVREGSTDIVNEGLLYGNVSTEAKDVPDNGTAYLLQRNDNKVGFYRVPGSGYKIGVNRCYLMSENAIQLSREAFFLEGEGETAINEVDAVEAKADGLKDGKYLINGRIVIVKDGKTLSVSGQILK